jgi:hypothetical protein
MPDADVSASVLTILERIARAIRRELGSSIDSYPGCHSPEAADPLNRAFRAVVRAFVEAAAGPGANLDATASRALRLLAQRRLAIEGWDDQQVKFLVEGEPGSPDDWLCFLILSDREQIEPLLDPGRA